MKVGQTPRCEKEAKHSRILFMPEASLAEWLQGQGEMEGLIYASDSPLK